MPQATRWQHGTLTPCRSPGLLLLPLLSLRRVVPPSESTHVVHKPRECTWETKKLHGVPITVKVPSQLEVRVIETKYLFEERQG